MPTPESFPLSRDLRAALDARYDYNHRAACRDRLVARRMELCDKLHAARDKHANELAATRKRLSEESHRLELASVLIAPELRIGWCDKFAMSFVDPKVKLASVHKCATDAMDAYLRFLEAKKACDDYDYATSNDSAELADLDAKIETQTGMLKQEKRKLLGAFQHGLALELAEVKRALVREEEAEKE